MADRLLEAAEDVGKAWCGSWLGYHSCVYFQNLEPPPPGAHFSVEWGFRAAFGNSSTGGWQEYRYDDLVRAIEERAGRPSLEDLELEADRARDVFVLARRRILARLDALLSLRQDPRLREDRTQVADLRDRISLEDIIQAVCPKNIRSRDSIAAQQGIQAPPHLALRATVLSARSSAAQLSRLADITEGTMEYCLVTADLIEGRTREPGQKVFIGHGRAPIWLELKQFIQDDLGLDWEEFNRDAVAGRSTKERLEEMLTNARFAFIVMTAEDPQPDMTVRARENVVHEVGLFQGRLGFERAIILLEEGCAEFSNVLGLGQIRFPPGRISAAFHEVRKVLQERGILRC